jgi:diguanylate cyclase (GGDEF)-like protein
VLLDLDHFKRVNDTLGHRVGDEVLVSFAARLRSVARESDRLFRYGGEEFAVLAVDSDEDGATSLAWRVVRATASRSFTAGQGRAEVTCSAGVAAVTSGDDLAGESVIGKADAALYRAKRQGRNRACVASGPVATAQSRPALELSEESC